MPERRLAWLRRWLVAGLAALFAGTLLVAVLVGLRLRQDALAAALDVAAMHSRAFEDHLTQGLQAVDLTIRGVAGAQRGQAGSQALFDILRGAAHLRSVSILDDDGRIVASSNADNTGVLVDTRGYFPPSVNAGQMRLGAVEPTRDFDEAGTMRQARADRNAGFLPLLRTRSADGAVPAILVALNADYYLSLFERNLESMEGRVRVVRYDGLPLLSNTRGEETADAWPAFAHLLETRDFGAFDHAAADGTHYVTAYRASRLYPFAVAVQFERGRVLAGWAAEMRVLAAVLAPLLAGATLLALFVYRRQRQLLLREGENERARRLAASVFEASSDAIVLTDPRGMIIAINGAFTSLNGFEPHEVTGRNPNIVSSGRQDAAFYRAMWEAILRDGTWRGELVNRRKDGSLYDALLKIRAVRDADGTLLHYVGTCADISQRKRHEAELVSARDHADAGARTKAAFLATMSHEIRTPMNGILGMTQLALMAHPPDKVRGYLEIVKSSANSLLAILNDVLDFSKSEAGHMRLEKRRFSPAATVESVADLFAARAAERGIALVREIVPEGLPETIESDEVRLRQILTNLLSNAIKFTESGSATIGVRVDKGGAALEFHVADTGIGIPADMLEAVFEPFSQADASITRKFGGTGLGLAICRQLADLLHGSLSVQSAFGNGSRFVFRMPLETADAGVAPSRPARAAAGGQRALNVLVAEDVPTNQALMRAMLADDGHQVTVVENGIEALARCARENFDLILMDLQMPLMDGLTATRELRDAEALSGRPRVPVIALTASVFPVDREACVAAGMDDFVAKPVDLGLLREAILRVTGA